MLGFILSRNLVGAVLEYSRIGLEILAQVSVGMEHLLDARQVLPSVCLLQVLDYSILSGECSGGRRRLPHEVLAHACATFHVGVFPSLD